MSVTNTIISAILQLVLPRSPFLPSSWTRRAEVFLITSADKPERRTMLYATLVAVAFILPVLLLLSFSPAIREVVTAPNTVVGRLRSYGFSGVTVALLCIKALVQTSLSEEILFRGFVAKRLISWLGFTRGNLYRSYFGCDLLLFIGQEFIVMAQCRPFTGLAVDFGLSHAREARSILPSCGARGTNAHRCVLAFVRRATKNS